MTATIKQAHPNHRLVFETVGRRLTYHIHSSTRQWGSLHTNSRDLAQDHRAVRDRERNVNLWSQTLLTAATGSEESSNVKFKWFQSQAKGEKISVSLNSRFLTFLLEPPPKPANPKCILLSCPYSLQRLPYKKSFPFWILIFRASQLNMIFKFFNQYSRS